MWKRSRRIAECRSKTKIWECIRKVEIWFWRNAVVLIFNIMTIYTRKCRTQIKDGLRLIVLRRSRWMINRISKRFIVWTRLIMLILEIRLRKCRFCLKRSDSWRSLRLSFINRTSRTTIMMIWSWSRTVGLSIDWTFTKRRSIQAKWILLLRLRSKK